MQYRESSYKRRNQAYDPRYNPGRTVKNEYLQEQEKLLTLYVSKPKNVSLEEALQILCNTFGKRIDNEKITTEYTYALAFNQPFVTKRAKLINYYKRLLDEKGLITEVREA